MALTLEERIVKSKAHTAKLEQQRRAEQKRERDIKKKKDQRRNYIVGELVIKYFPELMRLEPGNKAENVDRFWQLEAVLSVIADNKELMEQLKKKAARKMISTDKQECKIVVESAKCVSGRGEIPKSAQTLTRGS